MKKTSKSQVEFINKKGEKKPTYKGNLKLMKIEYDDIIKGVRTEFNGRPGNVSWNPKSQGNDFYTALHEMLIKLPWVIENDIDVIESTLINFLTEDGNKERFYINKFVNKNEILVTEATLNYLCFFAFKMSFKDWKRSFYSNENNEILKEHSPNIYLKVKEINSENLVEVIPDKLKRNKDQVISEFNDFILNVVVNWEYVGLEKDRKIIEVKDWLLNFESEEIPFIIQLLPLIQLKRDTHIYALVKKLALEIKAFFGESLDSVLFFGLGNSPASSGEHVLYKFRIALGLPEKNFASADYLNLQYETRNFVFFDDFIGSGKQATDFYNQNLKYININKYYFTLFGYEEGIENIKKGTDFKVIVGEIFTEDQKLFKKQSPISDKNLYDRILEIANKYGNKLYPNNPLGFEDSQSLICYLDNCPNNTLPIIWANAESAEKPLDVIWNPLFARKKSKKSSVKLKSVQFKIPIDFNLNSNKIPEINEVKSFLRNQLKNIKDLNKSLSFDSKYYVPLDAEVDITYENNNIFSRFLFGKEKKDVTDLLSAIKRAKSVNTFLLLGDPGSGKSVALRKLTEDLINDALKPNINNISKIQIPIYINLKEWQEYTQWTPNNLPTADELIYFIYTNLIEANTKSDNFVKTYFGYLLKTERFFFILDSFDEIPKVLDVEKSSWLIMELSKVIKKLFNNSRGIIASREYRQPDSGFLGANATLNIRPFTYEKIETALKTNSSFTQELFRKLFNERNDLIPIARNPFSATLLSEYVTNNNALPLNQAELYKNYIENKLTEFEKTYGKYLNKPILLEKAKHISYFMFESEEIGLEINYDDIIERFENKRLAINELFEFFEFARIGRTRITNKGKIFSFTHRRFSEYFVVQILLENLNLLNFNNIVQDSKWRDALILFCEVAPDDITTAIVDFCIEKSKIKKKYNDENFEISQSYKERLLSIRFFSEAFKSRKACIKPEHLNYLNKELKPYGYYNDFGDFLEYKYLVEIIGFLPENEIQFRIQDAIRHDNKWITETAINACRHLQQIGNDLKGSLIASVDRINDSDFLKTYQDLNYSFKLSESFKDIQAYINWKKKSFFIRIIAVFLCFLYNPILLMPYLLFDLLITKFIIIPIHYENQFSGRDGIFSRNEGNERIFIISLMMLFSKKSLQGILFLTLIYQSKNNNFLYFGSLFNFSYFFDKYFNLIVFFAFIMPLFETLVFYFLYKILVVNFEISISKTWNNILNFFKIEPKILFRFAKTQLFYKLLFLIIFFYFLISYLNTSNVGNKSHRWISYKEADLRLLAFSGLIFILFLISIFYFEKLINDRILLNKIKKHDKKKPWDRNIIETYFYKFKTSKVRYNYVEYIWKENIKANGNWKKNKVPRKSFGPYDDSSILLAQLEEKWLGLK